MCLKGKTCRAVKAGTRQGGSQAGGPFLRPDHELRCGWGLDAPKTLAMNWAWAVSVTSLRDKEQTGRILGASAASASRQALELF